MSKLTKRIILIVVILLVVLAIAWPKLNDLTAEDPKKQAASPGANRPVPVEVTVVDPQAFDNTLRVTGSVMANEMLELKSEVPGILEQINFKEGQQVRKGQLLFSIRNNDLHAAYPGSSPAGAASVPSGD